MNILAIDPGKNSIGICSAYMDAPLAVATEKPQDYYWIFEAIERWLCYGNRYDLVAIEGIAHGGYKSAIFAQVYGVIKAAVEKYWIPYVEVSPQTWKSITGFRHPKKTAADKILYVEFAKKQVPIELNNIDEVDAYMIMVAIRFAMMSKQKTAVMEKLNERIQSALRKE